MARRILRLLQVFLLLLPTGLAGAADPPIRAIVGTPATSGSVVHQSTVLSQIRNALTLVDDPARPETRGEYLIQRGGGTSLALPDLVIRRPFKFLEGFLSPLGLGPVYEISAGNALVIDASGNYAVGATIYNNSGATIALKLEAEAGGRMEAIAEAALPNRRFILLGAASPEKLKSLRISSSHRAYVLADGSAAEYNMGFRVVESFDPGFYCRVYFPPYPVLVGLEAVQVIQDLNNSVPLIAGKPTLVRAYFEPSKSDAVISGVTFQLEATDATGLPLTGSPLAPVNGPLEVRAGGGLRQREKLGSSLNFELPDQWTATARAVRLKLDVPQPEVEAVCGYALPRSEGRLDLNLIAMPALPVEFHPVEVIDYPIIDPPYYSSEPQMADEDDFPELIERLVAVYPVSAVSHSIGSPIGPVEWLVVPPKGAPGEDPSRLNMIQMAVYLLLGDWPGRQDRLHLGLTPRGMKPGCVVGGFGLCGGSALTFGLADAHSKLSSFSCAAAVHLPGESTELIHAHELGHLLNLFHPVDRLNEDGTGKEGQCGDDDELVAPDFPHSNPHPGGMPYAYINDFGNADFRSVIMGYDHDRGRVVPPDTLDFMSSCSVLGPPEVRVMPWISKVNYLRLIDAIRSRWGSPPGATGPAGHRGSASNLELLGGPPPPGREFTHWRFLGLLDEKHDLVRFFRARPRIDGSETVDPGPANFVLRCYDENGSLVHERPFRPVVWRGKYQPASEEKPPDLSIFALDIERSLVRSRVTLERDGQVLASVRHSAHPPTVNLRSPAGGETFAEDRILVSWAGGDADGDLPTYEVDYSQDDGASWRKIAPATSKSEITIARRSLPASPRARLRVTARDDFHEGVPAISASFAVANHAPFVRITAPTISDYASPGRSMLFRADVRDVDESVDPGRIQWRSDRDGRLGAGRRLVLPAERLTEGSHRIIIEVTDTGGATASDSIPFQVYRSAPPVATIERATAGAFTIRRPVTAVFEGATMLTTPMEWYRIEQFGFATTNLTNSPVFVINGVATVHQDSLWRFFRIVDKPVFGFFPPYLRFERMPSDVTATADTLVELTVHAEGHYPPRHQWFHNGTPVAGATASNLLFALTSGRAGDYVVVISNTLFRATSQVARVTIATPGSRPD